MSRYAPVAVALIGVVVTVSLAMVLGMSPSESWQLALVAGGTAAAVGVVGAAALVALRRSSVGVQMGVVVLCSVASVAVGAAAAASRMFLVPHDLHALAVMLAASAVVGLVVALLLGRRVAAASLALRAAARRIGEGGTVGRLEPVATEELSALAQELDETARRLDEARARERSIEASRRELVAWVSHDLRTPLSGIRAMVEALEDRVVTDADTMARYHHALRVEADRLAGLVDDLFELSRINAGNLDLELEQVSLGDLVSDALAGAAGVARAKGVRLEGVLRSLPELQLSPAEMARAIRNLLENAIRHTPSDRTVRVEAGSGPAHAYVAVSDSCGGIPQTDLERVFDIGWRGEVARSPDGSAGAGLGLAIARGIVEAHRGEIEVRNERGGCRFVVTLPLGLGPPAMGRL